VELILNNMKKIIILFLFALAANAKDYNTGIGLRSPTSLGITFKHFISNTSALEGIISTRYDGVQFDGLYEVHRWDFTAVKELSWYFGGGAYMAFFDNLERHPWRDDWKDEEDFFLLGISGIAGFEYVFANYPFNIGLDWKPYLNLIGDLRFQPIDFSLSIRYVF
jgi:hypothetical protein